jgi:hypothetical protein
MIDGGRSPQTSASPREDLNVTASICGRGWCRFEFLDAIDDGWIEDIEHLEEHFSQFTQKKRRANAFDLRYGKTVVPEGPGWELCEKVLSRRDVVERLSAGW